MTTRRSYKVAYENNDFRAEYAIMSNFNKKN